MAKSLYGRSRHSDINIQLSTDHINDSQHVVMRGSVRKKLPPGLTIKSSHIRIGESIGQGKATYKLYYNHVFLRYKSNKSQ